MASSQHLIGRTRFLVLLTTTLCILQCVSCIEFQVGERAGWAVPPANDTNVYNEWASRKRFKVGDTIRFMYKKDSVMVVNKTNYNECNSNRPIFFSNTGKTIYTLNRTGFFYFISGMAGHCEKGQRVIVWVIGQGEDSTAISSASKNYSMFSCGVLVYVMAAFHFVFLHPFF